MPYSHDGALGYEWLRREYALETLRILPPCYIASARTSRSDDHDAPAERRVREALAPEDSLSGHLQFALKHEGVDLATLKHLFQAIGGRPIESMLHESPLAKHPRRAGFFYEWLLGRELDVSLPTRGNYVDALPSHQYYALAEPDKNRRFRVNDNLPGTPAWCPLVRRTELLADYDDRRLDEQVREVLSRFDGKVIERAVSYLHYKETRASSEIEREFPDRERTERFVSLLKGALRQPGITKREFLDIQQALIDPRFRNDDYRTEQNYVGEHLGPGREFVHYVPPRPNDVPAMMDGLLTMLERCRGRFPAPQLAAMGAFSFVYIHPFDDGNGRTHRYLIHRLLAREGFTEADVVLPISAHMLRHMREYDECLERFSRPLKKQADYTLTEDGELIVHDDLSDLYRYFDATPMAEYLYRAIESTVAEDLRAELVFLEAMDRSLQRIRARIDVPDKLLNKYIVLCLERDGEMSERKRRHRAFDKLSEAEKRLIEAEVASALERAGRR